MPIRDEVQRHSRRTLRKYLLWIAPAAGLFLAIGLVAIWRQQGTFVAMANATLRSQAEQATSQLESEMQRAANDCLADADLRRIPSGSIADTRAFLERVRSRHPVARFFIVAVGGAVWFPLVREHEHADTDSDPAKAVIAAAEGLEMRERNPTLALAQYRSGGMIARSDHLRALALVRAARCLRSLDRAEESASVWKTVAEKYPDVYDPYGRPYGLLAGLELRTAPTTLYRDLIGGRWEISADQLEYFAARLGVSGYPVSRFAEHLEAARALEQSIPSLEPVLDGEVRAHAFRAGERVWQAFYASIPVPRQPDALVAFVADPAWLNSRLGGVSLVERVKPSHGMPATAVASILPFWEISIAGAMVKAVADARRWSLLMSLAAISMVLVFLYGLRLIVLDMGRAATANQIRQEHLRDVSHGLKSPLSIIRLNAESLLRNTPHTDAERREAYGDIVREAVELEDQITRMLVRSAPDDWSNLDLAADSLTETLRGALEAYCRYLAGRGVQVELNLPSGLPLVRLDSRALKQAVVNLIDNAVKYSADPPFVAIRCYAEPCHVVCEVEDHGPGIPLEEHARIFDRHYRGSAAARIRGSGLGLAAVQQIMHAHGGNVQIESQVGLGSRFRLKFPMEDSVGQAPTG